jgi:hypothetical protein
VILRVDQLTTIEKDTAGFEGLEIDSEHKRIIKGLVQSHYRSKDSNDAAGENRAANDYEFDLVRAKGETSAVLFGRNVADIF